MLTRSFTGNKLFLLAVSFLLLFGYLWVWGLGDFYFYNDNAVHLLQARELSWKIASHLRREPHPPLYYFLLKLAMSVFGVDHPVILRGISLLSGMLSIFIGFLLGKKLSRSGAVGSLVAFLLATSPLFISQGQALRGYSLLVFLILSNFLLFQLEEVKFQHWCILSLLVFLITLTHYSSIILLPSFVFAGFSKIKCHQPTSKNKTAQALWLFFLLLNAIFTYWMVTQRPASISGEDWHIKNLHGQVGQSFFNLIWVMLGFLKRCFGDYVVWIVLCLGLFGGGQLILDRKKELLILCLGPIITGILLSLIDKYPLTNGRQSLCLLPSFLLAVIWGCKWFFEKWSMSIGIIVGLIFVSQWFSDYSVYKVRKERERRVTELGPKFSEMREVREKLLEGYLDNSTVIFGGELGAALEMETTLKPRWAVFTGGPQKIISNQTWYGNNDPERFLCSGIQKLRRESSDTKIFLLIGNRQIDYFKKYAAKDKGCYQVLGEKNISKNFAVMSLK